MTTILEKQIKNKRSNLLKSDFKNFFDENNQITAYPKGVWFKGSRYR